ncbi:DUF484 family protein [Chromobacterium amazonense]|uniref:DUF484 family protein n=2 Tax=Chromobacterium amazonense TaxID=1382803 RepID=A0ABU8UZQ8_9NEIS|nr:DUF484 family protein [Chromobacterium amazonense]MBM2883820.1 DUF484 family protein [Chromobacterium amazonense]MDQ4540982.1 DUF484 family protein [Chromobacterium amazonense]
MHSEQVLAFLDEHPELLTQLAARYGLQPAPQNGDRVVVSFAERQLLELKDRNRQLEAQLQQLIERGHDNDRLLARLHRLTLAQLAARGAKERIAALKRALAEEFQLDRVALKLWHPAAEGDDEHYNARNEVQSLARNLNAPYCGPYVNDEVMGWFPAKPVLQSFAQVALRGADGQAFGILVLASDDAQRFTFDMHTQYLAQIGELASAALLSALEAA